MKKIVFTGIVSAFVLAACGGGGGSSSGSSTGAVANAPTVPTDAQGIYTGTDSSGDQITGIILDSGAYYFVYVNTATNVLGLVQGTATGGSGSFQSANAMNYVVGRNSVTGETVNATYTAKSNISGSITPSSGSATTFNGTYSTLNNQSPSIASIAGTYSGAAGSAKTAELVTMTLATDGSISGRGVSGCVFTGSLKPHSNGNYYDTSITFGAAPCLYAGQTVTGVVEANNNAIIAAATLPNRSDAFVLAATK
ncbi:hypothetical protein AAGS40_25330 (plasmid) [Paraburkholderia sp. PREW-6R]|uniref:hypothetical protein n=1 Tax=Paraburkholderia sp. PREW-6R TaxID=3141544 RepID=UPI0031F5769F